MSDKTVVDKRKARRRTRPKTSGSGDDLERRRALGQFYTPIEVARFIWEMLELLNRRKLAKGSRVIDPACGEGVFLHAAVERDRSFALHGVDIDETLAPKWRQDTKLKNASVHIANGLVDDPAVELIPNSFDIAIGNPPFAGTGLKDLLRLLSARGRATTIQPDLFDATPVEAPASQSPLLLPAERAQLDRLARTLSAYDCWRGRPVSNDEAEAGDGIGSPGIFTTESKNGAMFETAYDAVARTIAEWPAKQLLDVRQPELRAAIQRLASVPVEAYFVERFVRLVKPGGLLAMIVPESVLASDQFSPLRRWLLEQICLLAVVSLPHKVFSGVGAKVRTGIMFARRYTNAERRKVEQTPPKHRTRLPAEFEQRQVFMIMPSPRQPAEEWNLHEFLAEVIATMQSVLKKNGKGAPPCP